MSRPWNYSALLGCLALALLTTGCTQPPNAWQQAREGQKRILVSFPPLYSLTHAIAGDDAYVLCMLSGTGPHDYQFSSQEAIKVRGAELVIVNGLVLDERFMGRLINTSGNRGVEILNVGAELPEDMLRPMEDCCHGHDEHGHHHHHHHGEHDPHIWLGPPQAIVMAEKIAARLAEFDPSHASGYQQRAEKLIAELKQLHEEGKAAFAGKKNRNILTMHESMGYFAEAFNLEVVGSIQPQAGVDPDAARLAKLEKLCREKEVAAIAYEPQFSRSQPEMLQRQLSKRGLDVQLVEFDPLETAPLADGINPDPNFYFTRMRQNIENLVKALP